jgi:hypothetical protein
MTNAEILEFYNSANKCISLDSLNKYYNSIKHIDHPIVHHKIGVKYLIFGDELKAKELLIKGARFGLKYPSEYYNKSVIDSIGQCLALIVTQFYLLTTDEIYANRDGFYNATCLAYIYLSRAIELNENTAYDSFRTRAILFKDNNGFNTISLVLDDILQRNVIKETFVVSDFYFAASIERNPNKNNDMRSAINVHEWFEDISISGRDADEYELSELAEIGKKRHAQLYNLMKPKFINGDFYMQSITVD